MSTVAQEGVPGLYKGLGLQLCKTLISSALLYMIKEKIHFQTRGVSCGKRTRARRQVLGIRVSLRELCNPSVASTSFCP